MKTSDHPATVIGTRLVGFSIYQMPPLVLPLCSIRGEEIPDARPATSDRFMEDLTHGVVEAFNPAHRKSADLNMRVQTGPKENFIRVDIPDPGDNLLMHQERFEPPTSLLQEPLEILL
jgi:hypothetical protein